MPDLTAKVLQFIQSTKWQDLPGEVRRQAKRCLVDGLGAMIAGAKTPVGELMAQLAREQYAGDQATILTKGSRASLIGAALANGFAANALDIDDGYRPVMGHPGACALPVVLAASETRKCSGAQFLAALVVAYEVGIRAGLIRHATYQTYHSSGSWGAVAGAAAAGKLMGLDDDTLRHALGAAEYHAPIAPMMKGIATPSMGKDSIGWGCMVAVASVLMAQKGFTGICPLFDDAPEVSWVEGLGTEYEILNLYFKPYSACRWAQPAVDGALKIKNETSLSPDEIESIRVATFAKAAALSLAPPKDTEEAQYNMAFPIAAALIDGEVGPGQTLPPRLFAEDILRMMAKVRVEIEDRFEREFPAKAMAETIVETKAGAKYRSGDMFARWDAASPPTDDDLNEKFRWLAGPVLGTEKAREIEELVWKFEDVEDVALLIEKCAG